MLYERVKEIIGQGKNRKVATSKLMARKRPSLIPVRDKRLSKVLTSANDWWETWWRAMRSSNGIPNRLQEIRTEAGYPELPLLRVADIVIWKRHDDAGRPIN